MIDLDDLAQTNALRSGSASKPLVGPYRGIVTDNADDDSIGRIAVQIPALTGTSSISAFPIAQLLGAGKSSSGVVYGSCWAPEVSDRVYVFFIGGDMRAAVWAPGWAKPGEVADILKTHYPKRRGLVTPSGHALYFDDSDSSDGDVVLSQRDGSKLVLAGDHSANLTAAAGAKLELAEHATLTPKAGSKVRLGGSGANEPVLKGQTHMTDLETLLTQLGLAAAQLTIAGGDPVLAALASGAATALASAGSLLTAAVVAFQAAASNHLSTITETV